MVLRFTTLSWLGSGPSAGGSDNQRLPIRVREREEGFVKWYLLGLKKYAVFEGRAGRKEYWFFFLFNLLFAFVFGFIDGYVGTFNSEVGFGILSGIYLLLVLLPGLAVSVRRLHDSGRKGWWVLLALIPIIGVLLLLVLMAQDSEPGMNRYGPNPKALKVVSELSREASFPSPESNS